MALQVKGLGLYYKTGSNKEVELISPAVLTFERIRTEGKKDQKRVVTNNFNIDVVILLHREFTSI